MTNLVDNGARFGIICTSINIGVPKSPANINGKCTVTWEDVCVNVVTAGRSSTIYAITNTLAIVYGIEICGYGVISTSLMKNWIWSK